MSDHTGTLLTLPIRGVFALQVREQEDGLLVRLVGFDDEDEVTETHVPPLPGVAEANRPPWRRLLNGERNLP